MNLLKIYEYVFGTNLVEYDNKSTVPPQTTYPVGYYTNWLSIEPIDYIDFVEKKRKPHHRRRRKGWEKWKIFAYLDLKSCCY